MAYRLEIERTDVDGIPVVWSAAPPDHPFFAGLSFRVGRMDETLRTAGVTHLIEHLALPIGRGEGFDFNGSVDVTKTAFWAMGPRQRVLDFLGGVTRALGELPLDRLERERSILLAEAADRSTGHVEGSLALRYGASGPGLVGFPELGLDLIGRDELTRWVTAQFTHENCVVYMTGPPPDSLGFTLPSGARRPPDPPEPLRGIHFPSAFTGGPSGTVALSLATRRSTELTIGLAILLERFRERLRYRRGITYEVSTWYESLTADLGHVSIWADCVPGNEAVVRNVMLTELDELAHRGPTDRELARDQEELDRARADPAAAVGFVGYHAELELLGPGFQTVSEIQHGRNSATPEDVAAALTDATEALLLVVPPEAGAPGGRFTAYLPTAEPLRGRSYRAPGLALPRRRRSARRLVVGAEGVSYVEEADVVNVAFADVVAAQRWPEGGVTLWGDDGSRITIEPGEWKSGTEAAEEALAHVPESVVIEVPGQDPALSDADLLAAYDAAERGDADRAVVLARAAVERHSGNAYLHCALADLLVRARRWHEALIEAGRALEEDPYLEAGHRVRARALSHSGRVSQAVEEVTHALQLDPSELETLSDFAWIASEAGHADEARRAADRAVELYPESGLAWFARGWSELMAGGRADAERALRRATELEPQNAMWHNNLGWCLLYDGRPAEALDLLEKALALAPELYFARANRATALRELGRVDEARRALSRLFEERLARLTTDTNDADEAVERAETLSALGRLDEAAAAAERAVELAPDRAELRAQLSWLYLGLERWDEGLAEAAEAKRLAPEEPYSLYALAVAGACADRPETAAEAAGSFLRLHPQSRLASEAEGYAAYGAGRWTDAVASFRRTLELVPLRCCSQAWIAASLHASGDPRATDEHARLARLRCADGGRCASLNELARRQKA